MKLLVFAHTPPPHHGQSYMVKLMLDALGGDRRKNPGTQPGPVECYHVNARVSSGMEDIGEIRWGKLLLVLRYCLEAIWCRFRYGLHCFYYVPAPGKRAALYRDWLVMGLCRPFFSRVIYHWHAVGLGDWLAREGTWIERWITHRLLGSPALSISLAIASMRDSLWFRAGAVGIVPNGIPDPCPGFEREVLPRRLARSAARRRLLERDAEPAGDEVETFRVLYLAHCTREKGVFDTLDAVALANAALLRQRRPIRVHLSVAGGFFSAEEEAQFRRRIAEPDLQGAVPAVDYIGFVSGEAKAALFRDSDCYCFPTFYPAEGQPVSLLEAMAYGLPTITTRWRAIPEMMPPDYAGLVAPGAPEEIAAKLCAFCASEPGTELRARFCAQFTEQRHVEMMARALELQATGAAAP